MQPIASSDLGCALSLFRDWSARPVVTQLATVTVTQGVFRGPQETDWLVVSFMPAAIPGHNMRTWINVSLNMSGFPEPAVQSASDLLAWEQEKAMAAYVGQLEVDEAYGFTGLASFSGSIARLYTLLARKQRFAWKTFLSVASRAGAGNELANMRDDDRRAGGVFGNLKLASPVA